MAHASDPCIREADAGRSLWDQGQKGLQNDLQGNQGYNILRNPVSTTPQLAPPPPPNKKVQELPVIKHPLFQQWSRQMHPSQLSLLFLQEFVVVEKWLPLLWAMCLDDRLWWERALQQEVNEDKELIY